MERKITVSGKEVIVKEIGYFDALDVEELRVKSTKDAVKKMLELSTNLTADDLNKLSLKDGLDIQKVVNEVNKIGDFQVSGQQGAQS